MTRELLLALRDDARAARDNLTDLLERLDEALQGEAPSAGGVDPVLISDLKRDEGLRLEAYPDPLSGGDPWTIGYGHTGSEVRQGLVWTEAQCEAALIADIVKHNAELAAALPWVEGLDPARRRVLQNMAFNLGVGRPGGSKGLLGFKNTLGMVARGEYARAADGMLRSLWAKQVGKRAVRLSNTMRTGT